ncbi:MAG: 3,8-cyclase [Mycobacterium sp.]|jgi:cyclic pyranopterin phosphate synthase|nr:3,8-cyclase [Mycobacterium sp.]
MSLASQVPRTSAVTDLRGRDLRDLRISVTDRCNFRCTYCMPRDKFGPNRTFMSRSELLDAEEIERLAHTFTRLGVRKIRLTGGEPLVRPAIVDIVSRLAALDVDLALTTNGSLLPRMASALAAAGLQRVTVSLDSLEHATFRSVTDARYSVADVLAGIDAAVDAGLGPVKINTVVQRGTTGDAGLSSALDVADHFRGTGHIVRFIEFMDVGTTNGWQPRDVVPAAEILAALDARFGVEPVDPAYAGEVATRYRYCDGSGEFGIIRSMSVPFCGDCTRARLSADGKFYTCLFAATGLDLRGPIRLGATDADLSEVVARHWASRSDRYSELRGTHDPTRPRIEMSYIGG